jgi:UDP-GlcNAc:undecaprenyl-phosphate/decaprenyl-phosphate GlcNAc-1-phosphate transferase
MTIAWMAALVAPFIVSWAVTSIVAQSAWSGLLADLPNARSLHATPTPRVGGLGILAGALPLAAWLGGAALAPALGCALFLAAISLADDVRSLPVEVRLPAHAIAAIVLVLTSQRAFGGNWGAAAVAVVAIVWATNLFNFMDGADGLAGGMATIGFAAYAIAARDASPPLALACVAIASASCGFLALNFPPARVFMGDAGSIPLGFLAAAAGLGGIALDAWPAWFPLLVFSPFIADATVTLARRALRREAVWRAHRSHYYQRLVLSGWSKRRLALASYALMAAAATSALVALGSGPMQRYVIIAGWCVAYALVFFAIDRRAPSQGAR